ncbi:MAG: sigma-54-dependent Fis family transcriptional regulator, partial [Planctomycetes bacterium]|nr:sigma-54-dependent Fis family transcriptional regulator [Planctomycetota bacterium]
HEKGAFTGAVKTQPGKVETAEGGTLFLDEIGEISLALQAKLLRFLADRTFFRVGGARPRSVDVRIVAATNRDLAQAMKAGQFREDLYYRLAVVTIPLPPLRERREDIPALARHLLERVRARVKKSVREIAPAAMRALVEYTWPGNVRELENVIERAVILADGAAVELAHIPAEVRTGSAPQAGDPPVNLEEMEKWCVRRALERTGGKKGEAAQMLGISWPTLNKKLRDYGLEVGNVRQDGASDLEGVSP